MLHENVAEEALPFNEQERDALDPGAAGPDCRREVLAPDAVRDPLLLAIDLLAPMTFQ